MAWSQCSKRLWLEVNRRDLLVYSPETERVFAQGHAVGEVARSLHPGGVLIDPPSLGEAMRQTAGLLRRDGDMTLFEATFSHGGVLVRTDVLLRDGDVWRLIEVKSSTEVKEHHVADAAVQAWVLRGCDVPLDTVAVAHVDREFVYQGDGDYEGLLAEVDVGAAVVDLFAAVPEWVKGCKQTLAGELPAIAMGPQCSDPFSCPFIPFCGAELPEFHVSILPRARGLDQRLAAAGYLDLREVPDDWPLSDLQRRVWRVSRSGEPELDPAARETMLGLAFPRYYLDFETIQFAVPVWAGTRPWEQLPFQWSCHSETAPGALEHAEFLDISGGAPMRSCAERLLAALGDSGPILVYSSFEQGVLAGLAARFPDLAEGLQALSDRLVDLLPITRDAYYHPAMLGSWSIKAVLPTVAPDLDYASLGEVRDGVAAQVAYGEAIDPETPDERADEIAAALLVYCAQDSLALVRLVRFLAGEG